MSSDSSYDTPYASWDMTTVSEMGPTIAVRSIKPQGSKARPTNRVRAARATRGRDEVTKRVPAAGAPGGPSVGPDILKLHI
jgi:hypothetical protein